MCMAFFYTSVIAVQEFTTQWAKGNKIHYQCSFGLDRTRNFLSSTENKIQFAYIQKDIPKTSSESHPLRFSEGTSADWLLRSQSFSCREYSIDRPHFWDTGCCHQVRSHVAHTHTPPVTTNTSTWGAVMMESALFYVIAKTGKRKSLPRSLFPLPLFSSLCLKNSLAYRRSIKTNFFLLVSCTGIISVSITNG